MRPPIRARSSVPDWAAPARGTSGPAAWRRARASAIRRASRRYPCFWTGPTTSSMRRSRPWPGSRQLSPEIGNRLRQPIAQRRGRAPAQLAGNPGRVHGGAALLAALGRSMPLHLPVVGQVLEQTEDLVDAGLLAGAHIEGAYRLGGERQRVGLGHVGHVHEVAGLLAVPVDDAVDRKSVV